MVMDYYSRFIEILSLVGTTSLVVIQKLKSVFVRWGIPEQLVSDNGTQFKSAWFEDFTAKYGFRHTTSSPHHHQANGAAESGVRISKRILKQEDPFLALMAYRATSIPATGKTPSEVIMGRQIRTTLPSITKVLEPKLTCHAAVKKADAETKKSYKESFDRRNGTRELPQLQPGDWVRTKLDTEKQWSTEAKVVNKDQSPRSYIIDSGGRMLRRNRRHLRRIPPPTSEYPQEEDSPIPETSSETTTKRVQENSALEVSNTSPTSNLDLIPEQRTSSRRLIRKPVRYRE